MADPQMSFGVGNPNDPALQTSDQTNQLPPLPQGAMDILNNAVAPGKSSSIQDALGASSSATKALAGQEQSEMAPVQQRLSSTVNQPMPAPPNLHAEMMKAPQIQDLARMMGEVKQSSQDWIGASGIISGLVGAFSRKHTTLALKAFTAAATGFKKGQDDAVKQNMDVFKEANQQAIDNAKMLQQQYEDILSNRTKSVDEMMSEMNSIALKYHDQLMVQATDARDLVAAEKLTMQINTAIQKQQTSADTLIGGVEDIQARKGEALIAGVRAKGGDYAAVADAADSVLSGNAKLPPSSQRTPMNQAIRALVFKANPDYKEYEFGAKSAQATKLAQAEVPTKIGDTEVAIQKVDHHLDTLQDAMDALDSGDVRKANQFAQTLGKEFGDPNIVSAETAVSAVANEFHKVYVQTGGTEDERTAALGNLSPTSSPEQIHAAIKTMKELMEGQAKGIKTVADTIKKGESVKTLISPMMFLSL